MQVFIAARVTKKKDAHKTWRDETGEEDEKKYVWALARDVSLHKNHLDLVGIVYIRVP